MIIGDPTGGLLGWVADNLRDAPGALAGGFIGYVMHETYHKVWKKPAHSLIQRIFRLRSK